VGSPFWQSDLDSLADSYTSPSIIA
jgi:hypothetical protein